MDLPIGIGICFRRGFCPVRENQQSPDPLRDLRGPDLGMATIATDQKLALGCARVSGAPGLVVYLHRFKRSNIDVKL